MNEILLQATTTERHIFVFTMVVIIVYCIFQFVSLLDTP